MVKSLSASVRQAFAGVKLGNGIGLHEAQGIDGYADDSARAQYRAVDEKEDWSRIPVDELNRCHSSLSFFDPEGMRFHLPAYLIAELQGTYGFGLTSWLAHVTGYDPTQFRLFSRAQRLVVRAILLHFLDQSNYAFDRPHIVRALNEYWTEHDTEQRQDA